MLRHDIIGLYGKLPAHGDFISRDIPNHIVNAWDSWLQGFVSTSQQVLGNEWLDVYLTSPVWRFSLSDGILDEHAWQGIVIPSVDRVGRYFPFSIISKSSQGRLPTESILNTYWYEQIEGLALQALSGNMLLDNLLEALKRVGPPPSGNTTYAKGEEDKLGFVFEFNEDKPEVLNAYPQMMDMFLKQAQSTYSVWSTALGSDRIPPTMVVTKHLPALRGSVALLDGLWQARGWSAPVLRMD